MKLIPIKENMTELRLNNGNIILFSYKTPVAYLNRHPNDHKGILYKTSKKWSKTTTKHINLWMGGLAPMAIEKDQEFFDKLVEAQ